jgi:hypothetical protein
MGASHFNSFRLIRIKSDSLTYRPFEYDPRSSDNKWIDHGVSDKLPFVDRPLAKARAAEIGGKEVLDLSHLRSALERDAKRVIETKSRQLKPIGDLPATASLGVSVRVTSQMDRYDTQGRLHQYNDQFVSLPLYEACRQSRRTVLLGDLGSGKSTLAAQFVLDTLNKNPHALAFFIPAKALRLQDSFRVDKLVAACGAYIAGQIAPELAGVDLAALLQSQVEICLVIDGLDEVPRPRAVNLLRQLAALIDCWSNAQVLATGRPVELVGVTYEAWGLSRLDRLSEADKKAIFAAEALAEGCSPLEAAESANRRLSFLKKRPALDELAGTPLAVRLLYSKLDEAALPVADSIGDLLYELLIERLGQWSERDQKGSPLERFESAFAAAEDRADVLGTLARVLAVKRIGREEAAEVLRERVGGDFQLAKQALEFFQQAGVVSLDEEIGFNFQPLLEISAGVAMLGRWLAGLTPDSPGQPLPWRVAAFAAAVARRRGLLDRVRPRLQSITDELLRWSAGVPAACMIASEARDPDLACAIINAFRGLGRKPLYWNKEERFTSSRAIAHTIYMAGDKGFDWFMAEYLDPRYPVVHRGSLLIDEVLHHWTSFAFRTITEEQRRKLRPLVAPLLVAGGLFAYILPSLAILAPDAFQERQMLWFVSAFLDDELLGAEAERLLTRFNSPPSHPVLIDILCRRAHSSRTGLVLFFKLFPGERPPVPIAQGLLRWRALDPENQALAEALATCIRLAGEVRWPRFLRWCLSDEDSSVGAGAAILLHERGETRLNIVGSALLNALHDGGYVQRAEEILSDLIGQSGVEGVRWLAWHMAARGGHNGGHSGYWRVLLKHLDPSGEHSPAILARCAVAVGPFLLARYPEVRDGLQRLVTGPHGERFRKALRACLRDPDPEVRHGCGSILVTCDPRGEAEALFVVVATRSGITMMSHEWEPFCLSLAFGPSVLENLHSRLEWMGPEARAYALAVLGRHRVALTPAEQEALFGHLLEVRNWSLGSADGEKTGFESEEGFQYLRRQLASPATTSSDRSAERLLSLFGSRLSPEEEAKCWSRLCSGGSCNPHVLRDQMVRVLREPSYRALISASSEDVARGIGQTSLLEHVAGAASDANRWRDVVWKLLYEWHGLSFEVEEMGQVLLDLGRDYPEYAKPIGEAANHFLQDPRVKEAQWGENRQWLALLADEFSSLAPEEIREALTKGELISWNCARALMTRFGSVPAGVPRSPRTVDFPEELGNEPVSVPSTDEIVGRLTDWTRPAEGFHPATCDAIGQLVYFGDVKEDALDAMARQGPLGIMVAEAIRFCAALPPSLSSRLTLVLSGGLPHRSESDRPFQRLRYNVRRFHATYLDEEPTGRQEYVAAVEQAMGLHTDNIAPLASEILRFRGRLPPDQVTAVFEECANHRGQYQEELAFGIIRWISSLQPGAEADAVRQAAEHAIEILDQQGWGKHMAQFPPYPYLLFPIAVWALGGKASKESIDLYWYGISLVFSVSSGEFGIKRSLAVFQDFDALLAKVPQTIWASVREGGVKSDNPSIRTLIGMLGGFAGVLPQAVALPDPTSSLGPPEPPMSDDE